MGGIYLNASSTVSLTVKKSEFHSCKASPNRGGGIYAEEIKTVTIEDSLFQSCIAEAGNNFGGGGIQLWKIQKNFCVERTAFIACISREDGGGVSAAYCPAWHSRYLLDSSFVGCSVTPLASDNDGGSLIVWRLYDEVTCSNILFADSHSERRGGASSYYIYSDVSHDSTTHIFAFCFFKNNTAITSPGHDVYFYDWIPEKPFLHCFSLSKENRVRVDPGDTTYNDDWLPQATINSRFTTA